MYHSYLLRIRNDEDPVKSSRSLFIVSFPFFSELHDIFSDVSSKDSQNCMFVCDKQGKNANILKSSHTTTDFTQSYKMDKIMREVMAMNGTERKKVRDMMSNNYCDWSEKKDVEIKAEKKSQEWSMNDTRSKTPNSVRNGIEKENIPTGSESEKSGWSNDINNDIDDIDDITDDYSIRKSKVANNSDLPRPGIYDGWWSSDDDADVGACGNSVAEAKPLNENRQLKTKQKSRTKKKKR